MLNRRCASSKKKNRHRSSWNGGRMTGEAVPWSSVTALRHGEKRHDGIRWSQAAAWTQGRRRRLTRVRYCSAPPARSGARTAGAGQLGLNLAVTRRGGLARVASITTPFIPILGIWEPRCGSRKVPHRSARTPPSGNNTGGESTPMLASVAV